MRAVSASLVVVVGLVLLWLAATGKLDRLALAWHALTTGTTDAGATAGLSLPSLPALPSLPSLGASRYGGRS